MFRKSEECSVLLLRILNEGCSTKYDYRAIVDRMMKGGTRQNETVYEGHGYARGDTCFQCAQHAARLGAVNVKLVTDAPVASRNDDRLIVNNETNVANKTFVENPVNEIAVVEASGRKSSSALCEWFCRKWTW